jgi:hypothetical protein
MTERSDEADFLDELLDGLVRDARPTKWRTSEWSTAIDRLFRAGASTPEPDPHFLRSLRASLARRQTAKSDRPLRTGTLGIVARPPAPPFAVLPRRLLTVGAVAGSLILALVVSGHGWPDGAPRFPGVATAAASSTAIVPTQTATPETLPTVQVTGPGSSDRFRHERYTVLAEWMPNDPNALRPALQAHRILG